MEPQPDIDVIKEISKNLQIDAQAEQESKDLISGHKRNRREQNAMHWAFVLILWIIVFSFCAAVIIKILHMFLPDQYAWLNEIHLKKIDDYIFAGGVGGVGVGLLKSRFNLPK